MKEEMSFEEIKAEVFRVIRGTDSTRASVVIKEIKRHLPDVDGAILKKCFLELYESAQ